MNFCSIEDAWGNNKISDQFQKYKSDKICTDPQKLECQINEKVSKPLEHFSENNNNKLLTCDEYFNHINHCKNCYNKIYYKFNVPKKNEFINNLHSIINNNKDMIILMLIGIFIILFFKLVNNITSK